MSEAVSNVDCRVPIIALVACQCGLHACMAGMRVALPLQALQLGASKLSIGVLISCFAVFPAFMALRFGVYTDRNGYRQPAVIAALLSVCGAFTAWGASSLWLMFIAAGLCGTGSGFGMIAIQRAASRQAMSREKRLQMFSLVALAPALGGLFGPIVTGRVVDVWGFSAAYLVLVILPLLSVLIACCVEVAGAQAAEPSPTSRASSSLGLLKVISLRRVIVLNLLIVASWDLHGFALPILGHERGFSATEIGAIFAAYGGASLLVRGILPFVAKHFAHQYLPLVAMVLLMLLFAFYPLLSMPWLMMLASALFGVIVGIVQPTIMLLLHESVPDKRYGEALAIRSMCNQASITVLPLLYGVFGVFMGVATMFWLMAVLLSAGVVAAIKLITQNNNGRESLSSEKIL
jgi:MFS family permease